jgi:hypothetical protein
MQDSTFHNFVIITIILPLEHDSLIRRENALGDPVVAPAAVSGAATKLHSWEPNWYSTLPICFYLMVNSGGTSLQAVRPAQPDSPSRDRYQQQPSYRGAWTVVPKRPLYRECTLPVGK